MLPDFCITGSCRNCWLQQTFPPGKQRGTAGEQCQEGTLPTSAEPRKGRRGKDGKRTRSGRQPPALLPCPRRPAVLWQPVLSLPTAGASRYVAGRCPCWERAGCRTRPQGGQHQRRTATQPLGLATAAGSRGEVREGVRHDHWRQPPPHLQSQKPSQPAHLSVQDRNRWKL